MVEARTCVPRSTYCSCMECYVMLPSFNLNKHYILYPGKPEPCQHCQVLLVIHAVQCVLPPQQTVCGDGQLVAHTCITPCTCTHQAIPCTCTTHQAIRHAEYRYKRPEPQVACQVGRPYMLQGTMGGTIYCLTLHVIYLCLLVGWFAEMFKVMNIYQ